MKVLTTERRVWKGPTSTFYSYPSDTLVCANRTHVRKSSREREREYIHWELLCNQHMQHPSIKQRWIHLLDLPNPFRRIPFLSHSDQSADGTPRHMVANFALSRSRLKSSLNVSSCQVMSRREGTYWLLWRHKTIGMPNYSQNTPYPTPHTPHPTPHQWIFFDR